MASSWQPCSILLLAIILVAFASPADAFGAGYVAKGTSAQGVNFRHGDILNSVYFLSHAHSTLVRQIYFGNWLRDFSQLIDRKAMEVVPEPILRAVVAVFGQIQFGYTTKEFEVTAERLGSYRPEEHIDNPRGYEGGTYSQLRLQVLPEELAVEKSSGMKNYIASKQVAHINDTSLDFIEKQLVAAIACGRARDSEAYTHLGAALHTLEDFVAHSNWLELCMQLVGTEMSKGSGEESPMTHVFAFTGPAARVNTYRGPAPPLVTGTFGALDLYQTLLGEVDDKISAMSLPGLQMRTKNTGDDDSLSGLSKVLVTMFSKFGDNNFGSDITSITKSATEQPADWGKMNKTPELVWSQLEPVFRLRDNIVRWVYDHMTIDFVANAIASISTALDKLVYRVIGLVLGPVFKDISAALQHQSDQLLKKDQEVRLLKGEQSIFDDDSTATDPTHSQLCKDHYDHDLNELAGLVASKITTFTIKKVVEVWQPGSLVEVKPVLDSIVATLHHPYNYSKDIEVQGLMVAEVIDWCMTKQRDDPKNFAAMLNRLDRKHMAAKLGKEAEDIHHTHVHEMAAIYTGPNHIGPTTVHDIVTVGGNRAHVSFVQRISENIEKNLTKGAYKGLSMEDFAGMKKILESNPSADTPNPIDQSIVKIPGIGLVSVFEDIDMGEIVAAPGMGIILKDAVIGMRLADTEWVERQQLAAKERLGALEDRPVKEMLKLLDIHPIEKPMEPPTEEHESKIRKILNKLHIGSGGTEVKGVRKDERTITVPR